MIREGYEYASGGEDELSSPVVSLSLQKYHCHARYGSYDPFDAMPFGSAVLMRRLR